MNRDAFQDLLKKSPLDITDEMLLQFDRYRELLLKVNQQTNLIGPAEAARLYDRHFIDSLGLLETNVFSEGVSVVDLGSGAGFPGIPLKIIRPDIQIHLVESRQKRAAFLSRVIKELTLSSAQVYAERMENMAHRLQGVTVVVSRAVSNLVNLCKWSRLLFAESGGKLMVLKGGGLDEEIKRLQKKKESFRIQSIDTTDYHPFGLTVSDYDRNLVIIEIEERII